MRSRRIWRVLLMVGALALLAATVPIAGAGANGAPAMSTGDSFILYAGQDIPVGDVTVMNDSEGSLYVTFSTTSSTWCMTETHLQVAASVDGIPQTKKLNPIPGQFDLSGDHDCVKTVPYGPIEFGSFVVGDEFFVAAHAVVWDTASEATDGFYSDDDGTTMVTAGNVPLATYPHAAVDAWEAFNDPPDTTDSTWDSRVTHDFVNADWIWESYRVVDWTVTQSVDFEHSFTVPGYPSGGGVYVATDNMYSASMNGAFLGDQTNFNNWPIAGDYPFDPMMGANTLEIVGTNYGNSSYTEHSNPAGLIFEGWYSYYTDEESAWSTGTEFADDRGWATYSTYTIQPVLLETIQVPSRHPTLDENQVVTSATTLLGGVGYELAASGTYQFANWGLGGIADAQWNQRQDGTWKNSEDNSHPNFLEVLVNGVEFNWTPETFQPSHEYSGAFTGEGATVTFTIMDACRPPPDGDGCYTDNVGSIPVEIWWLG